MSDLMSLRDIAAKLGKSESRLRVVKTWDGFPAPKREWYAVGSGRVPSRMGIHLEAYGESWPTPVCPAVMVIPLGNMPVKGRASEQGIDVT
jgi:hypothetical protein